MPVLEVGPGVVGAAVVADGGGRGEHAGMMRFGLRSSWRRGALQLGLLAGTGLVFVGGAEPAAAFCVDDSCKVRAVRLMFALEYSTAMNQAFDGETTRWEKAVEGIESLIDLDNGYMSELFVFGLLRFGSDPDPGTPGTPNDGDVTGMEDGLRLDVAWYDPLSPNKYYVQCTDEPLIAALEGLPAPVGGIGSWTKGALEFTKAYVASSDADHPQDLGKRAAAVIVYTAGIWTDPAGTQTLGPSGADPKPTAAALATLGVPTYVVNVGGPLGKLIADPLAQAGGTGQVIDVDDLEGIVAGFKQMIAKLKKAQTMPVCESASPRVMIVLDASSAMLNVGPMHGAPGSSAWDQVRELLAGEDAVLAAVLNNNLPLDTITRFGLVAFGGEAAEEQALVMQYAYCPRGPLAWGLDPASSCAAPGCVDPYAAPPIAWTVKNGGAMDPPGFEQDVFSHMPRCDLDPQTPAACTGSGRFTHLGLQRVEENLVAYRAQCLAPGSPEPCMAQTPFLNLLITDGPYDSTDAQVQARLVALFEAGVVTRVFGIGDAVDPAQLQAMAGWGSGGALPAIVAADGEALRAAMQGLLVDFVEQLTFDECCSFDVVCEGGIGTETEGSSSGETSGTGGSSGTTEAMEGSGGATTTTGAVMTTGALTATMGGMTTTTTGATTTGGVMATSSTGATPTGGGVPTSGGVAATGESGATSEGVDAPDAGCACRSGAGGGPGLVGLLGVMGALGRFRRRRKSLSLGTGSEGLRRAGGAWSAGQR